MAKTVWYNPHVALPDTSCGERDGIVTRVFVKVKTENGKIRKCEFRRRDEEKGGAFCGFAGTVKKVTDPAWLTVLTFGQLNSEWYPFGNTSFLPQPSPVESETKIIGWRYDGKEKRDE